MSWEIIVGIITLIGCGISVGTLVWKLSSAVNRLECAVNNLIDWTAHQSIKNKEFYGMLNDHEKRISILESEER